MWSELDSLVEASMQEWKVPGLALAVIQDGEISVLKGFGVRDTETGLPVTVDTQFLLCSITQVVHRGRAGFAGRRAQARMVTAGAEVFRNFACTTRWRPSG